MLFTSNRVPKWFEPIAEKVQRYWELNSTPGNLRIKCKFVGTKQIVKLVYTKKRVLNCLFILDTEVPNACTVKISQSFDISYIELFPSSFVVCESSFVISHDEHNSIEPIWQLLSRSIAKLEKDAAKSCQIPATSDYEFFTFAKGKNIVFYELDSSKVNVFNHNNQHRVFTTTGFDEHFVRLD